MRIWLSGAIILGSATPVFAQSGFPIDDQISVIGSVLERTPANQSLEEIESGVIGEIAPASLADVLRLSASANITTNSRGETLVYLRNAGERQTAVYFDGAALNVPWDNRLNLSVLPADAIGSVAVQSGPASSLYGVNAAGGVIEISPLLAHQAERAGQVTLGAGDAGWREAAAYKTGSDSDADWVLAAQFVQHDDRPDLVNTDLERASLLVRYRRDIGDDSYASLSVLAVQSEFGIAPARFERDSQGGQRFWRYPQADHLLSTLRAGHALSPRHDLHATLWYQEFDQTIESYASETFSTLEEVQIDDDQAWGLRLLSDQRDVLGGDLRLSLTMLETRHGQVEFEAGTAPGPADIFADRRLSFGAEYERDLSDRLTVFAGASLDRLEATQTAGRPSSGDFETWNATIGGYYVFGNGWSARPSLSRKARIPTLRELYGTALNRFLPNPDLNAETLTSLDVEFAYLGDRLEWHFTPFYWDQADTLDQVNLTVNGARLRQRVNADGASALGLESRASMMLGERWQLEGGLTAMRLRRDDPAGLDGARFLSERPAVIARLAARFQANTALSLRAELSHRGRAYSFTDEDVFEPLAVSTALNLSAAYAPQDAGWTLYARIDNATDATIEPQLGLAEPGRWARAGVRIGF